MKFILSFVLLTATLIASPQMPRTLVHIVENKDAKLFCQVVGKGKPLIIIHGGPGLSQDYLLPGMTELAKNHTLIFYDQRACGRSEGNPKDAEIDLFVEDLEAIRKTLPYKQISILGHSWGGFLAMKYALAHPEAVEKLILMNSMPDTSEGLGIFIQEYLNRLGPQLDELATIEKSDAYIAGDSDAVAHHLKIIYGAYCAQREHVDLLNLLAPADANVNGAIVNETIRENLFSHPFKLELKGLKCKTLIVHGDKDVIPVHLAENLLKEIPGAKLEVIEDCGHFPYVEKPNELFRILEKFL